MIADYLKSHSLIFILCVIVLLFFFIFGLPTPIGSMTPLLVVAIVVWGGFNFNKYFLTIPKEIFYLFLFLLFDFFVCLIIPFLLGTYDFSIIRTKINFIISILAVFVLSKSLFLNNITIKQLINLLLFVFFIQSIFIVTMLLNFEFSQLITSFTRNSAHGVRVLETYAGARGLGIADSSAFGLAIVMGVFIFLTFYAYKNKFIGFKYFLILVVLGSIASVSAGRTALLGLIFGLAYLFLNFKNIKSFLALLSMCVFFLISVYFLLDIEVHSIENRSLAFFYTYSMEPILNLIHTGSLSSTSTDTLYNMYFPLTEKQFLIGDGRYIDGDGYYMKTDAGYMRFALFYGVFFSFFLYVYFTYFVFKVAYINGRDYLFFTLLVILSFVFHYKGEVIFFAISYNKVVLLLLFFFYFKIKGFGGSNFVKSV
ncbi:hypothetical protein [Acinetobacter towneri]|uniref:Wzy n=2 Tax=Acinetobacter towneri TaxID=202956 RepID=A0ABX7TDS2_9GAMM|nr:hypothetical protein [Acinetobacter towneri]QTD59602.1 hypothetical protein J4G44_02850 [Acinetobacter towneri]QTD61829.1 hypothetical protein J4G45_01095 [Acinetobacter towneri]